MIPYYGDSNAQETYMNQVKALDIFYDPEVFFIPDGKVWDELTEEEKKLVQDRYRFAPFRPGSYQGITGMKGALD